MGGCYFSKLCDISYTLTHLNYMKYFSILLVLLLSSCGVFMAEISLKNRENLNRMSVGMSKADVLDIMGTTTVFTVDGGAINSPYRVETIKDDNGTDLEVLFFATDNPKEGEQISDRELTPVILNNGKVQGWGRTYLASISHTYRYKY